MLLFLNFLDNMFFNIVVINQVQKSTLNKNYKRLNKVEEWLKRDKIQNNVIRRVFGRKPKKPILPYL
jgi:hypothetical protein